MILPRILRMNKTSFCRMAPLTVFCRCALTLPWCAAPATAAFADPAVTVVAARTTPSAVAVPVYQRTEFIVRVSGGAAPYANPFDPDEVAVDATVTGPGGRTLRVPAFWYAPYERRKEANGAI